MRAKTTALTVFFLLTLSGCGIRIIQPVYLDTYKAAETDFEQKKYADGLKKYRLAIAQQLTSSPEIIDSYLKMAQIEALQGNFNNSRAILNDITYLARRIENRDDRQKIFLQIRQTRNKINSLGSKSKQKNLAKVDALYHRALRFYRAKNYVRAYAMLKDISWHKDAQTYLDNMEDSINDIIDKNFKEGFQYYAEDKYKEAMEKFKYVLRIDADHKDALFYLNKSKTKLKVLESLK